MTILALTGGVGGAKLSLGLATILPPREVVFLVNVGDDFVHFGLNISPDVDTLTYTLADVVNTKQGWGRGDETWRCMDELDAYGGDTWFRLGDRDLGLHLFRTAMRQRGKTLTEVTAAVCSRLGIKHEVIPATDDYLRTIVHTDQGELSFQDYFVRLQCEPEVTSIAYAQPTPATLNSLVKKLDIDGVVICPSNPFLSIDPMLALDELKELLEERIFPVVAVSPIVGNRAIKGPTAKLMRELNMPTTCTRIAAHYRGLVDGFVLDVTDADHAADVEALGIRTRITPSIMNTLADKAALATACVAFLNEFR